MATPVATTSAGEPRYRGPLLFVGLALLGFVIAVVFDPMLVFDDAKPDYEEDWHRMFRSFGYAPLWLGIAVAFALIDARRAAVSALRTWWGRAAVLAASVLLSGLVAELGKLVLRRRRPDIDVPGYVFKPWVPPADGGPAPGIGETIDNMLSSSGVGLPSSHAAVAFGAAWALCRLHPAAAPVWLVMAGGCAATRVADGHHFLSDVYLAAVLSYAVAWQVWRWLGPAASSGPA